MDIIIVYFYIVFGDFFCFVPHDIPNIYISVGRENKTLSIEFSRHCVLSDGIQRRVLPYYQNEKLKY